MDRQFVYEAIEEEREYQDKVWSDSKKLTVTGEMTLIRYYMSEFDARYALDDNLPDVDVPEECLHILRKMAAILVRAMENNGLKYRKVEEIEPEDFLENDLYVDGQKT
jgi:hypothetical protein